MNHLLRALAPLSEGAWQAVEDEAARTLRHFLAARKLVDLVGPKGWEHSAECLGRVSPLDESPVEGTSAAVRQIQAMVELRTPFSLARAELDTVERGGDPDLTPVSNAARAAAMAEDRLVFHGYSAGVVQGIAGTSPHPPLAIGDDYNHYPAIVSRAVATLQSAGIGGPYGIALGPRCYTGVVETTEHGGYPVLEHLRLILGGPVVWAPAVDGAVVLSTRGGDFELTSGQDLSIGYASHDTGSVQLYLEESLTFVGRQPEAAVALVHTH